MDTAATLGTDPGDLAAPSGKAASWPCARPVDVVLVDDERGITYSLWALLNWQRGIRVLASADTADAAAVIRWARPAVCLISAEAGPWCIHRLSQLAPAPGVLVYANRLTAELDVTAAIAGAHGVLWRYGDPGLLAETIRRVSENRHRPPEFAGETIRRLVDRVEDRDRPIAAMLLQRIAPDEIARTIGISASSLRARRREIIRRLGQTGYGAPRGRWA